MVSSINGKLYTTNKTYLYIENNPLPLTTALNDIEQNLGLLVVGGWTVVGVIGGRTVTNGGVIGGGG